MFIKQFRGCG